MCPSRFRDDRWLYLALLVEFQATVDGAALRMLSYTELLWQRLAPWGATEAWKS